MNEPGDSYQKFMPYQQGDFDEKMRELKWWEWPLFIFACIYVLILFAVTKSEKKR